MFTVDCIEMNFDNAPTELVHSESIESLVYTLEAGQI